MSRELEPDITVSPFMFTDEELAMATEVLENMPQLYQEGRLPLDVFEKECGKIGITDEQRRNWLLVEAQRRRIAAKLQEEERGE